MNRVGVVSRLAAVSLRPAAARAALLSAASSSVAAVSLAGWGDPSLPPGSRERGPYAVEPRLERADLRRERIHLPRRGLLRLDRSRAQARERGHYGESVSDHAWTSPVQCVSE